MNTCNCPIVQKQEQLKKSALIRCEYIFKDLTEEQAKTMPAAVYDAWRIGRESLIPQNKNK